MVKRGMHSMGGLHGKGGVRARETASEAGGTHPTGMHSCFKIILFQILWTSGQLISRTESRIGPGYSL